MALVCASKRCENVHMFVTFPSFLFFSNVMIQDCTKLGSFFLFLWHVAQIHCKYQCKKALLRSPAPASKNGCESQMTCNLQYEMTPSCVPPDVRANKVAESAIVIQLLSTAQRTFRHEAGTMMSTPKQKLRPSLGECGPQM